MPIPPQTQILPRTTAKERVYQTLRQWIINGTLQPRERLNDVELARYFSVSRTPVREALQLLSEKKLVQIVPSSGTYVAPIDDQDMAHVYQLLVALQSLALELCIHTITPEQLERLEELNEHFSRCCAAGTPEQASEADYQFHQYLCGLSGNPYLLSFSEQLELQACRNENRFFQEDAQSAQSYQNHRSILEALRAGDLEGAKAELKKNWDVSLRWMLDNPSKAEDGRP